MQRASIQYWRSDEFGPVARAERAEAKVAALIEAGDVLASLIGDDPNVTAWDRAKEGE